MVPVWIRHLKGSAHRVESRFDQAVARTRTTRRAGGVSASLEGAAQPVVNDLALEQVITEGVTVAGGRDQMAVVVVSERGLASVRVGWACGVSSNDLSRTIHRVVI